MASKSSFFYAIIIALFTVIAPTYATDYMVGDNDGWKLGVNYSDWAQGKDFRVGDTLMFMYKAGAHNVLKVNVSDFKQCMSTNTSVKPLITGNDVITLATPGKKWYICGIGNHCTGGMRLSITVSLADGPTPAPLPVPGSNAPTPDNTSAATQMSPFKSRLCMLVAIIIACFIIKH